MLCCPSQHAPTGGGAQQNRYQPEQDSWKIEEEISNALHIIDKPLQSRARTYLELHERTPVACRLRRATQQDKFRVGVTQRANLRG